MPVCETCKWKMPGHPRWSGHFIGCMHRDVYRGKLGMEILGIEANEDAIEEGWFDFPFNFDPRWIKKCDGFKEI